MMFRLYFYFSYENKSDAFNMFKLCVNRVKNQYKSKIKRFHIVRGAEYELNLFTKNYQSHGILHKKTTPYSLRNE